jgi:hypothetical protein
VTIYDLRHSFISLMQEAGVPVADLASATGHERVPTLQDIYTHAGDVPSTAGGQRSEARRRAPARNAPRVHSQTLGYLGRRTKP